MVQKITKDWNFDDVVIASVLIAAVVFLTLHVVKKSNAPRTIHTEQSIQQP